VAFLHSLQPPIDNIVPDRRSDAKAAEAQLHGYFDREQQQQHTKINKQVIISQTPFIASPVRGSV
jgi:hypothetical protein